MSKRWQPNSAGSSIAAGLLQRSPPPGSNVANGGATGGGVEITHYGYPGDPDGDSNSENGIGNHSNQLVGGVSLAFSPDLISEYHLQVGQTVTVTMANGQVLTGRFDDTTADWLTGRVDIYDPNNTVTFSGEAVTEIDGAPAAAGYDTGVAHSPLTLFTTAAMGLDGLPAFLLGFFVMVLCVIGMFLMWLMSLLQQMLGSCCDRGFPGLFRVASGPWIRRNRQPVSNRVCCDLPLAVGVGDRFPNYEFALGFCAEYREQPWARSGELPERRSPMVDWVRRLDNRFNPRCSLDDQPPNCGWPTGDRRTVRRGGRPRPSDGIWGRAIRAETWGSKRRGERGWGTRRDGKW